MRKRRAIGMVLLVALASCARQEAQGRDEGAADRAALVALDQEYTRRWARNDGDGVMALFAEDAVIIPHDGEEPRVGAEAIRAFWFPRGASAVAVTAFEHRVAGSSVDGRAGVVWGRFSLAFEYENKRHSYDGNFLLVGRKQSGGDWKISHLTWNDPPPTIVPMGGRE